MTSKIRDRLPEYLSEALLVTLLITAVAVFGAVVLHPASGLAPYLPVGGKRRILLGLLVSTSALVLINSPLGKRSGAHLNPAVTGTFFLLGRIAALDALLYITAQFLGAMAGIGVAQILCGAALADPPLNFITTMPGNAGPLAAFIGELCISCLTMTVVLALAETSLRNYTGCFVALLVTLYVTFESPLSGASMNPARSFSPAFAAGAWKWLWIYFTAPPLGMAFAALPYLVRRAHTRGCAKLHHDNEYRCIFCGKAPHATSGAAEKLQPC